MRRQFYIPDFFRFKTVYSPLGDIRDGIASVENCVQYLLTLNSEIG